MSDVANTIVRLEQPELELERQDEILIRLVVRSGEDRVELGLYAEQHLRRLGEALELRVSERNLGEFEGKRVCEGLSSESHLTLYLFREDKETLGFAIQSKEISWLAKGALGAAERVAWRAEVERVLGARPARRA